LRRRRILVAGLAGGAAAVSVAAIWVAVQLAGREPPPPGSRDMPTSNPRAVALAPQDLRPVEQPPPGLRPVRIERIFLQTVDVGTYVAAPGTPLRRLKRLTDRQIWSPDATGAMHLEATVPCSESLLVPEVPY
jgi:hypothetical protein